MMIHVPGQTYGLTWITSLSTEMEHQDGARNYDIYAKARRDIAKVLLGKLGLSTGVYQRRDIL